MSGPEAARRQGAAAVVRAARTGYEMLAGRFGGLVELEHPLAPLTTYRLGGRAALYCEPESREDLALVKEVVRQSGLEPLVIGRGSNLLVAEGGFAGLVIRLGEGFASATRDGTRVVAGAAMALPQLARWAGERALTGLEFGVGIPASVGGAVRMNAGGHGGEIAQVLVSAEVCDFFGEDRTWPAEELAYSYRHSALGPGALVWSAEFELAVDDVESIRERMAEITRWRREHHPGGAGNAGSVFKNPSGSAAGLLIDEAGLKGLRVGGATVSEKHANFIVAGEDATPHDVYELMREVRHRVFEASGVVLEPEVRLVGDFAALESPGEG